MERIKKKFKNVTINTIISQIYKKFNYTLPALSDPTTIMLNNNT